MLYQKLIFNFVIKNVCFILIKGFQNQKILSLLRNKMHELYYFILVTVTLPIKKHNYY